MKMVKVRAKQFGQTPEGGFVQEGEEFEVPEGMVSKIWMERLDAKGDAEEIDAPRRAKRGEKSEDPPKEPKVLKASGKVAKPEDTPVGRAEGGIDSGDDAGDPGKA